MSTLLKAIQEKKKDKKKQLAVLIDPDNCLDPSQLATLIEKCELAKVDYLFVGGSLLTKGDIGQTIAAIKSKSSIPVIIFPGSNTQIHADADALLLLSLVSGRNPDFLIGQHVVASFALKRSQLELLATAYLLIDSGESTTAHYISGTPPIPHNKIEIAAATALAAQQLGMHLAYLDGGSGAKKTVDEQMVKAVRDELAIPLLVGGGITSFEQAKLLWDAGADVIVIGNVLERDPDIISFFSNRG